MPKSEAIPEQAAAIEHWAYVVDTPFRPLNEILESTSEEHPVAPAEHEEFDQNAYLGLAEDSAEEKLATDIDRIDGETDIARQEQEHPVTRLFRLPTTVLDALGRGGYATAITLAASAGYTSVNDLTNIVFYFRHPHVIGRQIRPDEKELQRDWIEIRDTIVRPAVTAGIPQPGGPRPAPGRGSLSSANLQWYGPGSASQELMMFMRAVYDRQMSLSTGSFVETLPESTVALIEEHHKAQAMAARKAIDLLDAARKDLKAEKLADRCKIGITSAYRSAAQQFDIWQGKGGHGKRGFPFYYTKAKQEKPDLFGNGHGREAVDYLARLIKRWIAAPGYSNHQDGMAIDFGLGAAGSRGLKKLKRGDWFHQWLQKNAYKFGFEPYETEAWHWVYKPAADPSQQETLDRPTEAGSRSDDDGWGNSPNEEAAWAGNFDEEELADGSGEADDEAEPEDAHWKHIDEAYEDEDAYLGFAEDEVRSGAMADWNQAEDAADQTAVGTAPDPAESDLIQSDLGDLAERVASQGAQLTEGEVSPRSTRWTRCFSTTDLTSLRREYTDNLAAAAANTGDRASCIVMLNVALGRLLTLRRKSWPARGNSARRLQMADLTTYSIERALERLTSGFRRGVRPI